MQRKDAIKQSVAPHRAFVTCHPHPLPGHCPPSPISNAGCASCILKTMSQEKIERTLTFNLLFNAFCVVQPMLKNKLISLN